MATRSVRSGHAPVTVRVPFAASSVASARQQLKTWMREQGFGRIVMATSTSGLFGNFGQANYGAAKLGIVALSRSIAGDMKRYNVRSNCISPFAWSRMISAIPTETDEQKARVERLKRMETAKIAPLAV